MTEIFIVNVVSTPTNITSCDYTSISLKFFLFVSVFNIMESGKKLGVGSVAWHPRTSGSLSHMEDMLLPTSFPCLFPNWENITDHGRYWI